MRQGCRRLCGRGLWSCLVATETREGEKRGNEHVEGLLENGVCTSTVTRLPVVLPFRLWNLISALNAKWYGRRWPDREPMIVIWKRLRPPHKWMNSARLPLKNTIDNRVSRHGKRKLYILLYKCSKNGFNLLFAFMPRKFVTLLMISWVKPTTGEFRGGVECTDGMYTTAKIPVMKAICRHFRHSRILIRTV